MATIVYTVNDIFITLLIATRMCEGGGEVTIKFPLASTSTVGLGTLKMLDKKKYSKTTMTALR